MLNQESSPLISVVMAVHNGAATLDRALRSVVGQTFPDWEVLAVDDASNDDSANLLLRWAAEDARIRPIRLDENCGVSAARNVAVQNARGMLVCYLDQDDEYYPDYLASVEYLSDKADVLVFGYDFAYDDGPAGDRPQSWDPRQVRPHLFVRGIATPLGVAHRRAIWQVVGGFNEAWCEEDTDLWRRMARAGAEFAFLPLKSGLYHVRADSASRMPHITRRQREMFLENWRKGRPLYWNSSEKEGNPPALAGHGIRKIVYAAPHSLIDPTSGAAVATAQGLRLLQAQGFQCRAFCGSRLDLPEDIETVLQRTQCACRHDTLACGNGTIPVLVASIQGFTANGAAAPLEVTIFRDESGQQTDFYRACGAFLDANRPDVVVTYGDDPLAETLIRLAKNRDLRIVFWLHNFAYKNPQTFALVDYVIVPTQTARQHYWNELGLSCHNLPCAIDWSRVEAKPWQPKFLTFVNPQTTKGLFVFARIAEVLSHRRPEIPILIVEGRASTGWQQRTGIDLGQLPNVTIRPGTWAAHDFYRETKVLLVPSVWMENACLVASEAMINGIPVLASNRGGLPEVIGDAGFLFDIPAKYTPETLEVPTAEEVEPWVETIIRLWDDADEYERWSRAARERAQQWHPDRLAPIYREFFGSITHQPGPPLVPKNVR